MKIYDLKNCNDGILLAMLGEKAVLLSDHEQAIKELKEANLKLVEALRFYAREASWTNSTDALMFQRDKIYFDKDDNGLAGKKARQTLAEMGIK